MPKGLQKRKVKSSESRVINQKKKLDISVRSVIDNMVFSESQRWAYYRLSNSIYDFLSPGDRLSFVKGISTALTNLMGERQTPLDAHLIVTATPIDVHAWKKQNEYFVQEWGMTQEFEDYLELQESRLLEEEFMVKSVYLGVHLGSRGSLDLDTMSVIESGFRSALGWLKERVDKLLSMRDIEVRKSEEEYARNLEHEFYQTLSTGGFGAQRCTAEEIVLLIKRSMYPTMPSPYLDVDPGNRLGPGDLELEIGHVIRNKFRWLEMTQMVGDEEVTGYRAALAFSQFPKETPYPDATPFMHILEQGLYPFNIFARFTMYPASTMRKEIEKQQKESRDEMENLMQSQDDISDATTGVPASVQESLSDMNRISQMIHQDNSPWLEGSYYVVVEAPTEERLKNYCAQLKQRFGDVNINLTWPAGDQAKLFLEQMPGDRKRVDSFRQTTDINHLAGSGMNFAASVGDDIIPRYELPDE